ncbi:uncharacterized protein LOC106464160 [Limulus polyphemus]|uniref:Uncharacterized protein LOC106464160 n=1 Tax=Limulus polyphemus TaxID=6850 RepID=A0ABM1SVA0_LIMPO|nr:uncharacterized protein LOC106464160 [Limulus polyphemus]
MGVEISPAHYPQLDIKSVTTPVTNVAVSMYDSQAHGAKRKFGEDSEMEPLDSKQSYSSQRKLVLNMSICKLNRLPMRQTLSLRRSVLIYNTMRIIQRECEQEGVKMNYGSNGHIMRSPHSLQIMTLDPPPDHTLVKPDGIPQKSYIPLYDNSKSSSSPSTTDIDRMRMDIEDCNLARSSEMEDIRCSYLNNVLATVENNLSQSSQSAKTSAEGSDVRNDSQPDDDNERYIMDLDASSAKLTPLIKTLCDCLDSGALWNEEGDRLTILNWSSVLNFSSSINNNAETTAIDGNFTIDYHCNSPCIGSSNSAVSLGTSIESSQLQTLTPVTSSPLMTVMTSLSSVVTPEDKVNTSPTSSPSISSLSPVTIGSSSGLSSGEEIFGDIDLSLYDFDVYSPLSSPNVKLAPVSAEDLLRFLVDSGHSPYQVTTVVS